MYLRRKYEFELSPDDERIMTVYKKAHKEDINYNLIVELVKKCHESFPTGMVLNYLNP